MCPRRPNFFANGRAATSVVQLSPSSNTARFERVNLGFSHSFEDLSVAGGRLYRANLSQLKVVYHLNVRTFVRAILQYTDVARMQDLYTVAVDARTRRLFSSTCSPTS